MRFGYGSFSVCNRSCQAENAPVAIYCQKCSKPLNEDKTLQDQIANQAKAIEQLRLAVHMLQDASGLNIAKAP